jgi:predicted glycoside hydrolase/deacetylase ChbG (UPF0249 family)
VLSILIRIAGECCIPVRHFAPQVRHYGAFYGQSNTGEPLPDLIGVSRLVRWLSQLPEGITELACHPGYADDLETMYRAERTVELRTLCDPEVRRTVEEQNIQLMSFADLQPT